MDTLDRMLVTMRSAFGALGRRGGQWVDHDGVGAIVTPSAPERSIVNGVIYERGADVAAVYDELAALFAGAWTVWVPEEDAATARFLEERGHVLDANPAAMVHDLAGAGVEFDPDVRPAPPELIGAVNEAAYALGDGSVERGMAAISGEDFHLYSLERGCEVSTLQATRLGEPVYARLGYETFGRIGMWERR